MCSSVSLRGNVASLGAARQEIGTTQPLATPQGTPRESDTPHGPHAPNARHAVEHSAHSPALAQAMQAFERARAWTDKFTTPPMDAAESELAIEECSAICVVLRRHGRVMGSGADDRGDARMLRRALGRAMNEVLADPALQSLAAGIKRGNGAARDESATKPGAARVDPEAEERLERLCRELGRTLTMEIEFAGPRQPLAGRSLEQLADKIEPGVEGVSLRRQQTWWHLFPAQQRIVNNAGDAAKTVASLAINAGVPMTEFSRLGELPDLSIASFDVVTLAQAQPEAAPERTFRGERLALIEHLDAQRIEQIADGIVRHMLARRWPDPPSGPDAPPERLTRLPMGMMGDYNPVADNFEPLAAPSLEQALSAWALLSYAQVMQVESELAKEAAAAARELLVDLAHVAEGETAAAEDVSACAALVMIASSAPSLLDHATLAPLFATAAARLEQSFDPADGFRSPPLNKQEGRIAPAAPISPLSRAMIAYAWARGLQADGKGIALPPVADIRAALDAAWDSLPAHNRVGLLPWIGWAEESFAQATSQPTAHSDDLAALADALLRAQVMDAAGAPPDCIGGFALTGRVEGGQSRPTSQSLRPGAWLAGWRPSLPLPRLDEHPLAPAQQQMLRFLSQLVVSDLRAASFRNPARARGGVCASPWDTRQPLAAQAMGLLMAVEAMEGRGEK